MREKKSLQGNMSSYRVKAFNIAAEMENKIHHDDFASRYGFASGLVPGTAVFGYVTHQPVALWGRDWLENGSATCRFHNPIYGGKYIVITAKHNGDQMDLEAHSEAQLCASGSADMWSAEIAPDVCEYPLSQPPSAENRPLAGPQSLSPGKVLCTRPYAPNRTEALQWLADLRETDPLYVDADLLHPATLLRLCNWTLMQNVALGPWIHTESSVRNFRSMPIGGSLVAKGVVLKNWQHKGHRLVELDVVIVLDGTTLVSRITHTAIYQPRQVNADVKATLLNRLSPQN